MQKIGLETQIDIPIKLLSNHSGRKTTTRNFTRSRNSEQSYNATYWS